MLNWRWSLILLSLAACGEADRDTPAPMHPTAVGGNSGGDAPTHGGASTAPSGGGAGRNSSGGTGGLAPGGGGLDAGGDGSGGAPGPVVTVTGRIYEEYMPSAEASVTIDGSLVTLVDADGWFTAQDVPVPYNLTAVFADGYVVYRYEGLTRPDPVVHRRIEPVVLQSATVTGALLGGAGFPDPPGYATKLGCNSSSHESYSFSSITPAATFDEFCYWRGGEPSAEATVSAVQYQPDANDYYATHYTAYASHSLALTADMDVVQDLTFDTVAERTVTGTLSANTPVLYLFVGDNMFFDPYGHVGDSYSLVVPLGLPQKPVLRLIGNGETSAHSEGTFELDDNTMQRDLSLPALNEMVEPARFATGVNADTVFSWVADLDGVHTVNFQLGAVWFTLVTYESEVHLPTWTRPQPGTTDTEGGWMVKTETGTVDQHATLHGIPWRVDGYLMANTNWSEFTLAQ